MAASDSHNPAVGYVKTAHPVQGLPRVVRHITGHDAAGRSVFLSTDVGDHHRELGDKSAIANILYSTSEHPVELNGDADVTYARENEVCSSSVPMPQAYILKQTSINPYHTARPDRQKRICMPPD